MKKLSFLSLVIALCAAPAFAGSAGVSGHAKSMPCFALVSNGKTLPRVETQVEMLAKKDPVPIMITAELLNGAKKLLSVNISTLSGTVVPFSDGTEHTYIRKTQKDGDQSVAEPGIFWDGIWMVFKPVITKDGNIELEFSISKSDLLTIDKLDLDNQKLELPQVHTVEINQMIKLQSGSTVTLPFSGVTTSTTSSEPQATGYTLKLTATKI